MRGRSSMKQSISTVVIRVFFHNVFRPNWPSLSVEVVYTQYNRMLTCNTSIMEQSYSTFDLRTPIGEEVVSPQNLTSLLMAPLTGYCPASVFMYLVCDLQNIAISPH
jgi:hypothetical protein